jgi:hypothetical protein
VKLLILFQQVLFISLHFRYIFKHLQTNSFKWIAEKKAKKADRNPPGDDNGDSVLDVEEGGVEHA